MAKKNSTGISPAGKAAILLVIFGLPLLFAGASVGLDWLFNQAPAIGIAALVVVVTIYTARTSTLLYNYYRVEAPILRFVPCLCEITLIDRKYHKICYGLYIAAAVLVGVIALPYDVVSVLGRGFVENRIFWAGVLFAIVMIAVQVVKGIGLSGCINDVAEDWYRQTNVDVGVIKKVSPLSFIPFVRVVALYSLNKPLETMVSFMGVDVTDNAGESQFYEEEDDD